MANRIEQSDVVKRALALWNGGGVKSKRDFTQIMNCLIEDESLSCQARFFYVFLKARAGQAGFVSLSNAEIKAAIGWDRKTAAGYRNELAASGLIVFTEPDARNKYTYYLFHPEDLAGYVPREPSSSPSSSQRQHTSEQESNSMNESESLAATVHLANMFPPPIDLTLLTPRMREWAARNTPNVDALAAMEAYQEMYGFGDEYLPESKERWREGWVQWMQRRQREEESGGRPPLLESVIVDFDLEPVTSEDDDPFSDP